MKLHFRVAVVGCLVVCVVVLCGGMCSGVVWWYVVSCGGKLVWFSVF